MTSAAAVRQTIVDALTCMEPPPGISPARFAAYALGERDIRLRDLALDSLARMELLIALELEQDTVISPDDFLRFASLDDIAAHVVAQRAASLPPTPTSAAITPTDSPAARRASSAIVRLYRRAFALCRTVAQLEQIHLNLEHRITPLELTDLDRCHRQGHLLPPQAGPKFHTAASAWLRRQTDALHQSGKPAPEPYRARRILPAVTHFHGPGGRAEKTLLLCFTANGRRLMVPHAALLQHLDARHYDVLVIADPWRGSFRTGVPLLGRDVDAVVRWVADQRWLRDYPRLRSLGLSAGAYPAILAGQALGAELTLSVSGRFPAERHLLTILTMLRKLRAAARQGTRAPVVLSANEDSSRDRNFARIVAWLVGGKRIGVHMAGGRIGHLMLEPLLTHGHLGPFLDRCLLAPPDTYQHPARIAFSAPPADEATPQG